MNQINSSIASILKYSILAFSYFALSSSGFAGSSGNPVVWGNNSTLRWIPTSVGPCIKMAIGGQHDVVIKANGIVVAWGANDNRQCGTEVERVDGWNNDTTSNNGAYWVKSSLGACTQIAAGHVHTLAIQLNGTVVAWGFNNFYQSTVPATLGPSLQIACGEYNSFAIRTDGTIVGWGDNQYGKCGSELERVGGNISDPDSRNGAYWVKTNLGACTQISAGNAHTVALQTNGTVVSWGSNDQGQQNIPPTLGACSQIAVGHYHTLALQTNGTVIAWGLNVQGECGDSQERVGGSSSNSSQGAYWVKSGLGICKSIGTGGHHSLAINSNRNVVAWGDNYYKQCDAPSTLGSCTQVGGNLYHSFAIQATLTSITGVMPISGPSSGGTTITITGTNFISPTTVTIGGILATNVVVVSDTQITAVTPSGFPGPAVVSVDLGSATAFYYRPTCGADLDNNNVVDSADLGYLLLEFGNCSSESAAATEPVEPARIPMIEQQPKPASKK